MRFLNSAVLLLIALAVPAAALAAPPQRAEAAPAAKSLKPDPKAAKKKPVKRRSARQVIESTPRIVAPATEAYGPTLYPAAPRTAATATLPARSSSRCATAASPFADAGR